MANTKLKRHGGFGGCCVYCGDDTNYGPAGGWVTLSSGGIGYGGFGGGGTSFGWGKMSGGINLSGSVWSNQSGWVTISYGGSSVEVYMTQGWNDINVWIPTLSPLSLRSLPRLAAVIPLPRLDTTPPVTNIYFAILSPIHNTCVILSNFIFLS
jgi:hypothetical protein